MCGGMGTALLEPGRFRDKLDSERSDRDRGEPREEDYLERSGVGA